MSKHVIVSGITSEKFSKLGNRNCYGFIAMKDSNKIDIRKDLESLFGVSVSAINVCNMMTRKSITRTKTGITNKKQSTFKKIYVYLKDDSIGIDFNKLL